MFKDIISLSNLEKAYFNLTSQMEADGRSRRYAGWDGLKLADWELDSARLIRLVRSELMNFQALAPAALLRIPKKNSPQKMREIYIYNFKDRVKAQAIYQVVEPVFDAHLSPWLFSYRSSHPSYYAGRSVVRHYRKYYQRDFVLVADVADYTGNIRSELLLAKIARLGFEPEVMRLFSFFSENLALRDGQIGRPAAGVIAGTPLIGLFYNIYLDDFDKYCGPRADFYRRVGDDLIIFDQTEERVRVLAERLQAETSQLGLSVHSLKSKFSRADQPFVYLGYSFSKGQIGLSPVFKRYTVKRWQARFSFQRYSSPIRKSKYLQHSLTDPLSNLATEFKQLAEQKKLITKYQDMLELSEAFFRVLTRYFFGTYSPKHRRYLGRKLKNLPLKSLYKYFLALKYGRAG